MAQDAIEFFECIYCHRSLPSTEYKYRAPRVDRDNARYRVAWCKKCHKIKKREYTYGISVLDILSLRNAQNNECAICKSTLTDSFRVDHCHTTNVVRGLLCSACNAGIGYFKDSVDTLESAIRYLKEGGN